MFKEPNIIFHHIPKCGGTSIVTGIVMAYYPLRLLTQGKGGFKGLLNAPETTKAAEEKGVHPYAYRRELLKTHTQDKGISYISGHYPVNHDVLNTQSARWSFVTLLRDPLERWYSEYYWNRHKDHEYRKTDLSIEAYFEDEMGQITARSFVNFFAETDRFTGTVSEAEVKSAIETLNAFDVVGVLENLERFRGDLKRTLGRKPLFFNRNSSPAPEDKEPRPDQESDFNKRLMDALAPDIEIYNAVKSARNL